MAPPPGKPEDLEPMALLCVSSCDMACNVGERNPTGGVKGRTCLNGVKD